MGNNVSSAYAALQTTKWSDVGPELINYLRYVDYPNTIRGGFGEVRWTVEGVGFSSGRRQVLADLDTAQVREVDELPASVVPIGERLRGPFKVGRPTVFEAAEPKGRFFATEAGHDLALRWKIDGRTTPLTTSGTEMVRWEVKDAVWSADGLRLAARTVDTTRMERFPVVHWLKPREEVEIFPAGRVGGAVESHRLHIVHRLSGEVVEVDSGSQIEQDLRPLGFSDDGATFYFLRTTRYKKPFTLLAADVRTGVSRVVREEHIETWVSYWEKGMACQLLPGSSEHLWLSERDGWAHLYRHDNSDGRLLTQVTSGDWPVTRIIGVDAEGTWVYFEGHLDQDRPYDTHLAKARLDGSGIEQLTAEPGTHHGELSPDGAWLVDQHSSLARLPATDLLATDGTHVARLDEAISTAADPVNWQAPQVFTVLAADGVTELHGVLYLPADFDSTLRYPVIESIYAGPNSAFVPQEHLDANGVQARALAELGFAVVVVDARGTPERSKAFHDAAYGNFADTVIADHAAALRQLGERHAFLDLSRVGVYGRSYGGYYAARALLEAPEIYHVGISVNGVFEMREGNGPGPIECVLGPLEEHMEAYEALSLYPMIDRLEGQLLLVHGTSDVNVPFAASLQFAEQLVMAGKPFDFLPVNEQPHHFTGVKGRYLALAKARYFREHLGGPQ